ncbi:hypothetical protein [Herbidospora sp. RD11066]
MLSRLVAVAMLVLALTGCTEELPPRTDPPTGPISSLPPGATVLPEPEIDAMLRGADPVDLPLTLYMIPMDGLADLELAVEQALFVCMHEMGHTGFEKGVTSDWTPESFVEREEVEYLDPARAAEMGYPRPALNPDLVKKAAARPSRQVTQPEGEDWPDCEKNARSHIYVSPGPPVDVRVLVDSTKAAAMADSRMREAVDGWRVCMGKQGFAYRLPSLPRENPAWRSRPAGQPAGEEERRTARTDAECQEEVNLAGVYKTLRAAYETELLRLQPDEIETARQVTSEWLDRARMVLGGA